MNLGMHLPLSLFFILAYYANCNYHINREDFKDPSFTEDKDHTKYTENLQDIGKFYDEAEPYHKELEKRGLRGFLFGAQLFLTLTNVGADVFLGNKGCCIVQKTRDKDACEKLPKVRSMEKQLAALGKTMDQEHLESQLAMSFLDNLNNNNILFRTEISRLRDLEESIVVIMNPKFLNEYKNKLGQIKELLAEGKEKTEQKIDVTELYKPLYKSWEGRAKLFGALGLNILGELGERAFDRTVTLKLARDIEPELAHKLQMQPIGQKATKVLVGVDDIRVLSISMAETRKRMSITNVKRAKLIRGFTNFMSVAAIGAEIFELYNKFKNCADSYNKLKKTEKSLEEAMANATGTYTEMQQRRTEIDNQYKVMKDALANQNILDVVGDFRDFVLKAESAARRRMRPAEINLHLFLTYIEVESPSLSSTLQEWAIEGLQAIKPRYDCLLKRTKAVASVTKQCKDGSNNLTAIYQGVSKDHELHLCVTKEGEPFTTFEQIKEFNKKASNSSEDKSEWYNPNCKMNNDHLLKVLCTSHCRDGHSYEVALATEKVTSITIAEIKKVCEPEGKCDLPLTPTQTLIVCNMKTNGFSVVQVKSILPYDGDKIDTAYAGCN